MRLCVILVLGSSYMRWLAGYKPAKNVRDCKSRTIETNNDEHRQRLFLYQNDRVAHMYLPLIARYGDLGPSHIQVITNGLLLDYLGS